MKQLNTDNIKSHIKELSIKYLNSAEDGLDEFKITEWLENEAQELIMRYCKASGYLTENNDGTWLLAELALKMEDVGELYWHYHVCFWPDFTGSKDVFLEEIREGFDNNP